MLEHGGNAFDAALAAGIAAAVTEPTLTSLGGSGFMLAWSKNSEPVLFDFFADTPGRGRPAQADDPQIDEVEIEFPNSTQMFGIGDASIAVPGVLAGYLHVHRRLGRVGFDRIVAPAVEFARNGLVVDSERAYMFALLEPILTSTESGRAIYAPSGRTLHIGDTITMPETADFLDGIGSGTIDVDDFYTGSIAAQIASDMASEHGLLSAEDLAAYRVIEREPLEVSYRDFVILTNPPPSLGGALLGLSLELFAETPAADVEWGSGAYLEALVAVMIEVDRRRAGLIDDMGLSGTRVNGRGTTHVNVADAEGNVASMTTSNGEGSGYVVPGTGIMLNNMLGEDDLAPNGYSPVTPGVRISSMMAPSIVLCDGVPRLALGSGGSKRIRTALLQVITSVVDHDLAVRDAVDAPRVHWDGEFCQIEPGFSHDSIDELAEHHPVNVWDAHNMYFGGVHTIDPAGRGHGDPRRGGAAEIVRAPTT